MNGFATTALVGGAGLVVMLMATAAQAGDPTDLVAAPDVVGLSAGDARDTVVRVGLAPQLRLGKPPPSREKALAVVAQHPAAGQMTCRRAVPEREVDFFLPDDSFFARSELP